ncbi:MAG: hypothetical protein IPN57_04205 [Ignavibacteria bacterium]|nr:hypothetical protein [Ignavibacteria bacterium]
MKSLFYSSVIFLSIIITTVAYSQFHFGIKHSAIDIFAQRELFKNANVESVVVTGKCFDETSFDNADRILRSLSFASGNVDVVHGTTYYGVVNKGNSNNDSLELENYNEEEKDTVYYENDEAFTGYIENEFEFIRNNKVKSIKISNINVVRKEYYNLNGELAKTEYIDNNKVWGVLDFIKIKNKYFYKLHDYINNYNDKEWKEVSNKFFIYREWPDNQTIAHSEIIFGGDGIELIYEFFDDNRNIDFYIYNDENKIEKILTFSYSYEYEYPNSVPKDFKAKSNNPNIIPILKSEEKYNYNSDGKLMEIMYMDLEKNKSKNIKIEYNERGLKSKNEKSEDLEYEYYK